MTRFWNSLQFKIPAIFIFSFFLILVAVIGVFTTLSRGLLEEEAYQHVSQSGKNIVAALEARIAEAKSQAITLANIGEKLPREIDITLSTARNVLDYEGSEEFIAGGGLWPEPFLFDEDIERHSFFWGRDGAGVLRFFNDYNEPEGPGYHHEEWYVPARHLRGGEPFWSKSYMDPYSYEPMVTVTVPMYRDGLFYGVSTVDLKLTGLKELLGETARQYGGYAFALDRNGKLLSFPNEDITKVYGTDAEGRRTEDFISLSDLASKKPVYEAIASAVQGMNQRLMEQAAASANYKPERAQLIDEDSYQIDAVEARLIASVITLMHSGEATPRPESVQLFLENDELLGEGAFVSIFEMPETFWKVITVMPYSKAVERSELVYRNLITTIIAVMGISLLIMLFLIRRFLVLPFQQISKQLSELDESSALEISDRGELGMLVKLFNRRSQQLVATQEELHKAKAKLEERVEERTRELNQEAEKTLTLQKEKELRAKRIEDQYTSLLALSLNDAVTSGRLIDSAREINEVAAEVMGVARTSIWIMNDAEQCFETIDLYDRDTGEHSSGHQLPLSEYPSYFNALETHRSVAVEDIFQDTRTGELDAYARKLDIGALLDSHVRVGGELRGIICFEHIGSPRYWHRDEIRFSGEIADQFIQVLANHERTKTEAKVRQLAFYDSLTELANRRLLQESLQHEIEVARRRNDYGCLLYFDLDNFKTLNDSLGHHVGDELLVQLARRLKSVIRKEDMASRLGGDEFVVMLSGQYSDREQAIEQALLVGNKIQEVIGQPYHLHNYEHVISSSMGITLFPENNHSASDVLKQADTAMYRAKDEGRNRICFYNPAMQEQADRRLTLEAEIRTAINEQQFEMYYQPQVNAEGSVVGCESLIRWNHPEKGVISPAEFIPVCEQTGMILELGQWILADACAISKKLELDHIAVNISAVQFRHPDFVEHVKRIIEDACISPEMMMLELTESIVIENIDDTVQKMNALKEMGIRMSIDDFGTGYSSLAYLKRLPLDQLKINNDFVQDVTTDVNDAVIVETIISMARHLGLHVVAEGVENEEQMMFLMNNGCELYQGYYFSRPIPQDAFLSYLSQS
jgi:diguanylate cyclase (GGDEF)-like protein